MDGSGRSDLGCVCAEGGSAQPKGKRRKTEREKADKLDSLVTQYKMQLFGEVAGKGAKGSLKSSMQRWFE